MPAFGVSEPLNKRYLALPIHTLPPALWLGGSGVCPSLTAKGPCNRLVAILNSQSPVREFRADFAFLPQIAGRHLLRAPFAPQLARSEHNHARRECDSSHLRRGP